MAFDEQDRPTPPSARSASGGRAYDLLTQEGGFAPEDIIFRPQRPGRGHRIAEHNGYAKAFIEALPKIKERCPGARTSGGISNLSFAFRVTRSCAAPCTRRSSTTRLRRA